MTTPAKAPAQPAPAKTPDTSTSPMPRKFTVDEYYRMAEAGILSPKDRIELIRGEIVLLDRVTPLHACCKSRMAHVLYLTSDMNAYVSVAHPVRLNEYSEPHPDIAILRNRKDSYITGHPGPSDTLVVVEISDSSLAYDRGTKVHLYAEANILETWIMNLVEDCIEVFTEPGAEGYARRAVYRRGDRISPSSVADVEFAVDDLLPPAPEEPESQETQTEGEHQA